jgi:hypothetical protein
LVVVGLGCWLVLLLWWRRLVGGRLLLRGVLLGLVVLMLRLLLLPGSGDGGEIFRQLILATAKLCALAAGRLDMDRGLAMAAIAASPRNINDHGLTQNLDDFRGRASLPGARAIVACH